MLDGAPARVGYADGVSALALAEAADESMRTGAPVQL
jgi:myo-inositol 2-dehydrogenase/D-chiro-inositol 1-dehydrogenase